MPLNAFQCTGLSTSKTPCYCDSPGIGGKGGGPPDDDDPDGDDDDSDGDHKKKKKVKNMKKNVILPAHLRLSRFPQQIC